MGIFIEGGYALSRAVVTSRGPGISLGYYECGSRLLSFENRRKKEPKEVPCCLIPRLLVVFTQQLEILVTTVAVKFQTQNVKTPNFSLLVTSANTTCLLK